jgi:transcriptional regulator with XRE-family HTH domain
MGSYRKFLQSEIKNDSGFDNRISFHLWVKYLGLQIGKIRDTMGKKQEDLAKKMGITQSAIARIESGQNMTLQTLWKLGEAFNTEINIFGVSSSGVKNQLSAYIEGKEDVTLCTVKDLPKAKHRTTSDTARLLSDGTIVVEAFYGNPHFNLSSYGQESNATPAQSAA